MRFGPCTLNTPAYNQQLEAQRIAKQKARRIKNKSAGRRRP